MATTVVITQQDDRSYQAVWTLPNNSTLVASGPTPAHALVALGTKAIDRVSDWRTRGMKTEDGYNG